MPSTSTHLMNWEKITYKNPPPSTIKYIGKNIIDKRFDNYKNKYNTPHIAMLDHFKNFELIDVEYNDKNPWTLDGANAKQAYATHMLYQSNFANGTYRITKPGYYELQEDIVFSPDPRGDDTFMPTETQIQNGDYPTMNTSPTGYYGMGFFAAITVEAPDVIINLNNYMIKQSAMHKLQQRFFACIELASAPFTQGAGGNMNRSKGPHQFGPTPIKTANNLYICNGTLGSSSGQSPTLFQNISQQVFGRQYHRNVLNLPSAQYPGTGLSSHHIPADPPAPHISNRGLSHLEGSLRFFIGPVSFVVTSADLIILIHGVL